MSSRESRAVVRGSACKRSSSIELVPPSMSADSPLRILLLGKSVSENSHVGNLILGRSAFDSEAPPDVVERVGGRLKHRHVTLINSPQLLHTHISDDQITQTVRECVSLSDPGPHVVLLLLQHQQCSAEDQERVEKLQDSFSERLLQHTLVLSTQEPTEPNQILQKIIQKCSNRHFSLQTSSSADHLLQAFEDIERSNEGRHLISGDSQCSTVEKRDTQTHSEKLNVLVCGSDGSLKSSISELILQHTHRRSESVRTDVINVLELPALFNSGLSEEEVMRQTLRCVSLCHPGVHAFLLIIPDAPLNNEDRAEMEEIQKIFSSRINKHIMILIMQNSEHQTAELNEETQAVIQSFGGRHHHFSPETQVSTLMENIEKMLEENRGGVYSTETFLEAQMENRMKYEEMKIKKSHLLETPLLTQEFRVNTDDDLRIVLLGKTGVGKSTTGNTIIGRKAFTAETSHQPVTKESQKETCEINGRQVTVIDTPGVFDTELTEEEIQREIRHCISMILPGPHVFLLLVPLGRFTKEEETSVKIIQETFGENSLMFTMVLFTRGDFLGNKSIEEFLGKPGSPLMNLIKACGHRYHVFNNTQPEERTQVSDLLEKIDNMVKANGGSFYSCKMFREMEREKQEQQMKILMGRVRETEEEMKKLEEEKDRMKMMMEEERQNQETERKIREEELKREIREGEKHQREMKEEMKRERETFRHEIEEIRREKEKMQIKHETETDRLMKRMEDEQESNETEKKRRKEEFNEREERYKREMNEREEKMKREREEWEKQRQEEKKRREEEDEKRREKEQREFEKLNEERDQMEREKEDLQSRHKEEEKKMKIQIEELNREREELMKRHEEEKERMKMMMMEERQETKTERREERKETEMQFNLIKKENLLKVEKRREQEKWEKPKEQSLTSRTRLQDNGNINIVLLGKTGVGKSSLGNTILGENRFRCARSQSAVTNISSIEKSVINGRSVSVIDTPGFFSTNLPKEQLAKELARSVHLSASGVHAFLFVVPYGMFTEQEEDILKRVQKVFGKDVLKHVIILFTYGDECDKKEIQKEIDENKVVSRVVQRCHDYHVFNNKDQNDRQQVNDLLLKIDSMVEFNQGCYANEMYEYANMTTFECFLKIQKDMFFALNDYSAELFRGAFK